MTGDRNNLFNATCIYIYREFDMRMCFRLSVVSAEHIFGVIVERYIISENNNNILSRYRRYLKQ